MLGWRLISATAFLVPLLGLLVADYRWGEFAPGLFLLPVAILMVAAAAAELVDLFPAELAIPRWPGSLGAAAIVALGAAPLAWDLMELPYPDDCPLGKLGWPLAGTAVAVTITLILETRQFRADGKHVLRIALTTFVIVYVGLFLSFLYPLRTFAGNEWGMVALLSMLVVVKMSDVGAYTIGKLAGRRPLAPRLSPAKTIEGAVGGFATAAAVSWIFFRWIAPPLTGDEPVGHLASLTYGLVLAAAAIVGDLAESLIKRDMARKDSSVWLPGLGGILDMLDSVIVATPTAFLCWTMGMIGPGK